MISFFLILFFGTRCIISVIIYIFLSICQKQKLGNRKKVLDKGKEYYKRIFLFLFLTLISTLTVYGTINYHNLESQISKIENFIISFLSTPKELFDPYTYGNSVETNETYTRKEKILYSGLYYEYCQINILNKKEKHAFEEYIKYTKNLLDNYNVSPDNELLNLDTFKDYPYLLDKSLRTLTEIDDSIKSYDKPSLVPAELYIEEFYARAKAYALNPSGSNAYQTARSADDIVTQLDLANADVEMCMYFSAYSIKYYFEALKYSLTDESPNDILLKMAIIFQKLTRRSELIDYKIHFLFFSNALMYQAQNFNSQLDNYCNCYFNYYYGTNLYSLGILSNIDDIDYYANTLDYLNKYLESGCPRDEYIKTCKDIIIKITNYYPELNTSNESYSLIKQ